jgi:ribonuclease D
MVFMNNLEGKMSVEKPRKGWLEDAENELKKMDARGWRKIPNKEAWKLIPKDARVLRRQ